MWGANHPTKHLITKTQWTLVVTDNGTVMGVRSREDKPKFGESPPVAIWDYMKRHVMMMMIMIIMILLLIIMIIIILNFHNN